MLRLGLDTTLRRGCHALARADRIAVSVHRCCAARLAGTEDVTAKVFGTVPGTTDRVTVTIQFNPATGGGAEDLSRSIRLAGRIGLGTHHLSFPVGRAGSVIGLRRYAAQEHQDQRDCLNEGAATKHGHLSKAWSLAIHQLNRAGKSWPSYPLASIWQRTPSPRLARVSRASPNRCAPKCHAPDRSNGLPVFLWPGRARNQPEAKAKHRRPGDSIDPDLVRQVGLLWRRR